MLLPICMHLKFIHWPSANVYVIYKITWFWYHFHSSTILLYLTDMLKRRRSLMLTFAHMLFILTIHLHTVRQHSVIVHFIFFFSLNAIYCVTFIAFLHAFCNSTQI